MVGASSRAADHESSDYFWCKAFLVYLADQCQTTSECSQGKPLQRCIQHGINQCICRKKRPSRKFLLQPKSSQRPHPQTAVFCDSTRVKRSQSKLLGPKEKGTGRDKVQRCRGHVNANARRDEPTSRSFQISAENQVRTILRGHLLHLRIETTTDRRLMPHLPMLPESDLWIICQVLHIVTGVGRTPELRTLPVHLLRTQIHANSRCLFVFFTHRI